MSILKKPYELSLWIDVYDGATKRFKEQRLGVIGADTLTSQSRAHNVSLVKNVNGSNTLTFTVYFQYKDIVTGETVLNPVCSCLTNEQKLKLQYDGQWYDFIIKSVKKDSSKYTYDISATDQYINELSKNGYNVEFDADLNNNVGTIQELAATTLNDTDWDVPKMGESGSEFIPDYSKEALIELSCSVITASHIVLNTTGAPSISSRNISGTIYAFYSCCATQSSRFQFIYLGGDDVELDDERIIINKDCQYYIDNVSYEAQSDYGISIPAFTTIKGISPYRGKRIVFSATMQYNSLLDTYATAYDVLDSEGHYQSCWGLEKTDIVVPKLLTDYISNSHDFKSTSGWRAVMPAGSAEGSTPGTVTQNTCQETVSLDNTLLDALLKGETNLTQYLSYIDYQGTATGILMNTGFYDNRLMLYKSSDFVNNTQFVLDMEYITDGTWTVQLVPAIYNPATSEITIAGVAMYSVEIGPYGDATTATFNEKAENGDIRCIKTLALMNQNLTPEQLKYTRLCLLFIPKDKTNPRIRIKSCHMYRCVRDKDKKIVTPFTQTVEAITTTTYVYYKKSAMDAANSIDEVTVFYSSTIPPLQDKRTDNTPKVKATLSCERRRAISAKQSNYYNIIQTLCEKFECWAEFVITRDENTNAVIKKSLIFHNYIGKNNYAGFRYGVNLKSISRTDDSKAIVTKLIVSPNSNEFGKNGYCAIGRAPSNETGEDVVFNFDYYINTGVLSAKDLVEVLYNTNGASGADIDKDMSYTNCMGYYIRLRRINDDLQKLTVTLNKQLAVQNSLQSNLTLYESGLQAADDEVEKAIDKFELYAGWPYTEANQHPTWCAVSTNKAYLVAIATALEAQSIYASKLNEAKAEFNKFQPQYNQTLTNLEAKIEQKAALNQAFYELYYRFIQEGTWISEDYFDDEQYYLDAVSTLYTSAVPSVTYNISVLELSQLEGYTDFVFALGDKTFVEDPEFFGYDENGYPVREDVVLTEINYNLDAPEKNTIKVQNYKSQFQDLFKRMTATVQSVTTNTGSYEKAAELAVSTAKKRGQFLQEAFDDADMTIRNAGEQTVTIDERGLTIADKLEPNNALRAVCGGIALTTDGGDTWTLGLTSKGVSANLITSGILNTGEVNIMTGTDNTFRWDAFGLTAYDFLVNEDSITELNTNRGVRFDHFGIYGFEGIDGAVWVPKTIAEWEMTNDASSDGYLKLTDDSIRNHSTFELTKEGLYLSLGHMTQHYYYNEKGELAQLSKPIRHGSSAIMGKTNDLIYNAWSNDGFPYYDDLNAKTKQAFVKIFSVGLAENNEQLAIYDDGTLVVNKIKLAGSIEWTDASSPSKSVYGHAAYERPADGTYYKEFPDTDATGWHKISSLDDKYYCHTDNGGATWQGPFGLSGTTGEPSYSIEVKASNGTVFQNLTTPQSTTLQATVLAGSTDITNLIGDDTTHYSNWTFGWYLSENNGNITPIFNNDGTRYTQSTLNVECPLIGVKSYQCVVNTNI